jgi:hypothetical protein
MLRKEIKRALEENEAGLWKSYHSFAFSVEAF